MAPQGDDLTADFARCFENLPGLRFLWEERDLYAYKVLISKKQVSFLSFSFF